MHDLSIKDLSGLEVLALSDREERLADIEHGVRLAGVLQLRRLNSSASMAEALADRLPGVAVISLCDEGDGHLRNVLAAINGLDVPVVLFLDEHAGIDVEAIMDAGVSTLVVDGFATKRLPHIVETTLVRHSRLRGLQIELDEARSALEDRKMIDRAKGILMKQRDLSEPDAYALMRKAAMSRNVKVADIASSIVIANDI